MQQNAGDQPPPTSQGSFYNLDPSSAAKQMAALSSAGKARRAAQGPSDDNSLSPNVSFATIGSYQAPPMSHPQQMQQRARQNFFAHLASVMNMKGTPLPPSITGVQAPYDPSTSVWKTLEPSTEIGVIKLFGKDIDLHKLFNMIMQAGGSTKVSTSNGWNALAQAFGLPLEIPQPQGNPIAPGIILANYYKHILLPVEELYLRNMAKQQQALQQAKAQGAMASSPTNAIAGGSNSQPGVNGPPAPQIGGNLPRLPLNIPQSNPVFPPTTPTVPPPSSAAIESPGYNDSAEYSATPNPQLSGLEESDGHTNKRKREASSDGDGKRLRNSSDLESELPGGAIAQSSQRPVRRKIEYIPIVRETSTHGGRDLEAIDIELHKIGMRRPLHGPEEWGMTDIDGLTMSLRSRLPPEVSFSLTTLAMLSTMRGQNPAAGFPLNHSEDLLDEILDFLDETAFEALSPTVVKKDPEPPFYTYRELSEYVLEEETRPLAGLKSRYGNEKRSSPCQSPAQRVLSLTSILRNFSLTQENQLHMGKSPNVVELVLRLSEYERIPGENGIRPLSPVLCLRDLLQVRRDALHILLNIAGSIDLKAHDHLTVRRVFNLTSSFLVDKHEALGPMSLALQSGSGMHNFPPPLFADFALEALSKLAQPDGNRRVLAQLIPVADQWGLIEALLHRMPVSDADYKIAGNELWFSYIEKLVFSLYCLVFIASPELKRKIRNTRSLGFAMLFLRIIKRFTLQVAPEYRPYFSICARRAIEALKLIDDGRDSFDTPQMAMPQVAFGMGFGEHGNSEVELGMGMLGGYQDDVTWGVMRSEVVDQSMFSEMESLARVG